MDIKKPSNQNGIIVDTADRRHQVTVFCSLDLDHKASKDDFFSFFNSLGNVFNTNKIISFQLTFFTFKHVKIQERIPGFTKEEFVWWEENLPILKDWLKSFMTNDISKKAKSLKIKRAFAPYINRMLQTVSEILVNTEALSKDATLPITEDLAIVKFTEDFKNSLEEFLKIVPNLNNVIEYTLTQRFVLEELRYYPFDNNAHFMGCTREQVLSALNKKKKNAKKQ